MKMVSKLRTQKKNQYVPLIGDSTIRMAMGFILLVLSAILAGTIFRKGRIEVIIPITAFAWLLAVFLTDKYIHKYPQRYLTYLVASHLKAAIIMAFFLWIMGAVAAPFAAPHDVLWSGYVIFVFADVLVSLLRRWDIPDRHFSVVGSSLCTEGIPDESSPLCCTNSDLSPIDKQAVISQIRSGLDNRIAEFIEKNLPDFQGGNGNVLLVDDVTTVNDRSKSTPVGLLVGRTRINNVRHLNKFLLLCVKGIAMRGYLVVRYMPLENVARSLKDRYAGLFYWPVSILHFVWHQVLPKIPWLNVLCLTMAKRRNRVLSKAEVWGRLSYYGMHVIAESRGDGERYLIAQRVALPVQNKRPSYYLIVGLEKVGLDDKIIRMHKIRTMFPYSEFLQKRICEEHGLTSTGKVANDFRLTRFGKFLRKYWLDELPQIFDWLRGDVKLVGMRATSRHFLSLYPKEFMDLYVQIKPGLISPIFDESTDGFDQIAEVELTYLQRYWDQPFRTDVLYFFRTFSDIVFKGIRSR